MPQFSAQFRVLTTLASLLCLCAAAQAGTIRGVVRAEAPPQNTGGDDASAYSSRQYKFLDKVDYSKLSDFVVSIADVDSPFEGEVPQASVAQVNGTFQPNVLPIVRGTEVSFPNRDAIFHNVFSMSEARQFDLGYYKKEDDAKRLIFDRVGKVDVFCSIHAEMNCAILVLPNPWFDMADRKGRFEIKNVPAGTYRLKAWQARLPTKFIEVVVPEEGEVTLEIVMGFADLPKIQ